MTDPTLPLSLAATLLEGRTEPLGALARDGGVNFAVFSDHAESIELCLFDGIGQQELRRVKLQGPRDGIFHGFLPGAGPGLVYGLRAHGPDAPAQGDRFNPAKLLLDPWAREIVGRHVWRDEHHGYSVDHPDGRRTIDRRDNAAWALKARVSAPPRPAPGAANRPRIATADMVLYEMHVKGFSQQHPDIPSALRGSYAALAHPAAIDHFKRLGVTTLSLLPVQYALDEPALAARGMVNYWGYNTLGFFCPDPRLAATGPDPAAAAAEFRAMVTALHEAGLEVVLDVVYNHTPEGDEGGATLSWRGLDHASWYRLQADDKSRCENLTGCGNTLNVVHPRVTQFVLDSLRYWVAEMGVDGFRFDLAPVLGRTDHGYDAGAAFFTALRQDPVLAQVHLIAEPWDAGAGGYQVGHFPGRFLEWNDKFRDAARRYWLGQGVGRGEMARRLTASSDLFQHGQRAPGASINFLAVHDGFTLQDLVSHSRKHNLANGEHDRDGRDGEPCANFGVEGTTLDAAIQAARGRAKRAMLATLLLAQGTPMLCAGDETGNGQGGNNNAYNQDNPTGWLDWAHADDQLTDYVARCLALRRELPLLRSTRWWRADGDGERISWWGSDGNAMTAAHWHAQDDHALGCLLDPAPGSGTPAVLLLLNPAPEPREFVLPQAPQRRWRLALDSASPDGGQACDQDAQASTRTEPVSLRLFVAA